MAFDTLRGNSCAPPLTILGVVIGITAIVGMTSRFVGSMSRAIPSANWGRTPFAAKFSGLSVAAGKEFKDLLKRPVLTVADAMAVEREAPSAGSVDVLGAWGLRAERAHYKRRKAPRSVR